MCGMYERFCEDVSEEVFNSVYRDLYYMAEKQQKALYETSRSKKRGRIPYTKGEHQEMLDNWCMGRVSLGECLDYIRIHK